MIKKFIQAKKLLSLLFFLCALNTVQAQCLIGDIDATPTASDFNSFSYYEVGDYLYFTSTTQAMGNELFMLNFNTEEITFVDINPGPDSSEIKDIHIFGDYLYFTADDGKRGRELWKVDIGTLDTAMVDINKGAASSFLENNDFFAPPTPFIEVGGKIYFPATNNGDTELYMVTKGMLDIAAININPDTSSFPKRLLAVDNQLYFIAETGRVEDDERQEGETNELIVIEGGTLDTTIIPETGGIDNNTLTIAGDYLYFTIVQPTSIFGGEGDLFFLQKDSTGGPTKLVTMLDMQFAFPVPDKDFFYNKLYFLDKFSNKLFYTTPGSSTIDTITTPLSGEAQFIVTVDSVSNLYYGGFNSTTNVGAEFFVLQEGATTSIKTEVDFNRFNGLYFLRERNNKLFMQNYSTDSIAISTMDLTTYEVEILDIRPGNFLFGDLSTPGEIFSDSLIITHRYNQLVTINMETSEITNDTLNYPDSLHLAGLTLRGNDYYYFHGEVGKPGGGIYKVNLFEAGTGSEKTVNIGEEINLASLVEGEDTGGEWIRKDGTGGTFNETAGTVNITAGFTNSTFLYVNNACQSVDTAIVKLNFTLPSCPMVNAGVDTSVCNRMYTLQGNTLQTGESGEWIFINNPSNLGSLGNASQASTVLTMAEVVDNEIGSTPTVQTFTLQWKVTSATCTEGKKDTVVITLNPPVSAGFDRLAICGTTINLGATPVSDGTGSWSFITNPKNKGSIADLSNPNATLTGVIGEDYELQWTITGGACDGSMDRVKLAFQPDSDDDTFQDCVDLCEGGDDRINTDNTGVPDACDCDINDTANELVTLDAASFTTFMNEHIGQDTAKRIADYQLTATTVVIEATHPVVVFQVGNNVILKPGFHAKVGSNFIAEIGYCKDPLANDFSEEQRALSRIQSTNFEPNGSMLNLSVFPNPMKQEAAINLTLPTDMLLDLVLFNQNGQLIRQYLHSQEAAKGAHYYKLDASNLPSGLYFLQLRSKDGIITKKLVVQKY